MTSVEPPFDSKIRYFSVTRQSLDGRVLVREIGEDSELAGLMSRAEEEEEGGGEGGGSGVALGSGRAMKRACWGWVDLGGTRKLMLLLREH